MRPDDESKTGCSGELESVEPTRSREHGIIQDHSRQTHRIGCWQSVRNLFPSMKITSSPFPKLASFWPTVGVGCALALSPLAVFAQSTDAATEKAS